ncbi:hypothetical protein [Agreia sp.]|uniref:hypothetical protein n=1 Tax=Agreia sp. TaxID=1872416 RepID=UPI0035BBD8F4
MSDEPLNDLDATSQHEPAPLRPPDKRPRPSSSPPPRPVMSDNTSAPIIRPVLPSGAIQASRYLWFGSFVAGVMVALFAFLARSNQTDRIQDVIRDLDPDRDADTLETAANIVLWGSLGAVLVVLLVELALLFSMLRGRGWIRFVQLPMLVVHAIVAIVADALIVGDDVDGVFLRALLAAQLLLAVAGFLASFLPGTRAWFRREK